MRKQRRVDISIIIPTFNSMPYIKYVLKSIEKQSDINYEIIIVDRYSTDGTVEIAKMYGAEIYQLDAERTKAVNYGAKKASGTYIYYLGSDYVLLKKNHLKNIVEQMNKFNADAGIISNLVDFRKGFWARARFVEKLAYYMDPIIEAARVFKRDVFLKEGGYREDMVAYEEHELHYRLLIKGYKIIRIKGAIEIHIAEPTSLEEVIKKYYYYGSTSVDTFFKRTREYGVRIISPIRSSFIYRFHWLLRVDPLATVIGLPLYQFSRYTAGMLGLIKKVILSIS